MDKRVLLDQLIAKVTEAANTLSRESVTAAIEAKNGATAKEKSEDARVNLEQAGLARGTQRRVRQMRAELTRLQGFEPSPDLVRGKVGLGCIVEIEDEDSGTGRTFFLAPAGAGLELTAPGGDGFFTVVTPHSPVGRAAIGCEVGDSIEVTVAGETRYWEITWAE